VVLGLLGRFSSHPYLTLGASVGMCRRLHAQGGTCKAGHTNTRDCLYTTLTMSRRDLETTLEVTMLARSTMVLMTQLSDDGLGPLWV
jgi:hypothetical protein